MNEDAAPTGGPEITWVVEEGQVRVGGGVTVVHRSPGCLIVDVDLASKYAELVLSSCGDDVEAVFVAGDRTLHLSDGTGPTVVTFSGTSGFRVMSDGGRYSWRVCFYARTMPGVDR